MATRRSAADAQRVVSEQRAVAVPDAPAQPRPKRTHRRHQGTRPPLRLPHAPVGTQEAESTQSVQGPPLPPQSRSVSRPKWASRAARKAEPQEALRLSMPEAEGAGSGSTGGAPASMDLAHVLLEAFQGGTTNAAHTSPTASVDSQQASTHQTDSQSQAAAPQGSPAAAEGTRGSGSSNAGDAAVDSARRPRLRAAAPARANPITAPRACLLLRTAEELPRALNTLASQHVLHSQLYPDQSLIFTVRPISQTTTDSTTSQPATTATTTPAATVQDSGTKQPSSDEDSNSRSSKGQGGDSSAGVDSASGDNLPLPLALELASVSKMFLRAPNRALRMPVHERDTPQSLTPWVQVSHTFTALCHTLTAMDHSIRLPATSSVRTCILEERGDMHGTALCVCVCVCYVFHRVD